MKIQTILIIALVSMVTILALAVYFLDLRIEPREVSLERNLSDLERFEMIRPFSGDEELMEGTITRIIDGDTLEWDDTRVRLAFVDAPERGKEGYEEAKKLVERRCPVGSTAFLDIDEITPKDKYGRTIGVIHCRGLNLNVELLELGYARFEKEYCSKSVFAEERWAKFRGCWGDELD